jgi:hypothetical protein
METSLASLVHKWKHEVKYEPRKEYDHMKRLFTFVVAAIIALSFSAVGFAQDKAADTKDQPAAAEKMEKKAEKKKPAKKAKKAAKKDAMAPAATDAAPAPAK